MASVGPMAGVGRWFVLAVVAIALAGCGSTPRAEDALGSWRGGASRDRIVEFVDRVTDPHGSAYVPEDQRVAVFDHDGTIWAEQPVYFQFSFAMDRVRELAPGHPEWRTTEPFRSALAGDIAGVLATGEEGVAALLEATHTGMTPDEFRVMVRGWLRTARHPETGRPFTEMVYEPMVELMWYLRSRGFRVVIVSGGGQEFMRAFTAERYGLAAEHVVGSRFVTELDESVDPPVLIQRPKLAWFDDKAAKPAAIWERLGLRPIMAFGNSDGDYQMLRWVTAGEGPRLGALVRHTDAEREWAYDRDSHIGQLDRGLDEAGERGWVVIDMARDWARVFAH